MPYPTQRQSQQLIELETLLDYYLPRNGATTGVDIDARTIVTLAAGRDVSDRDRDAIIRFVGEWLAGVAQRIEDDRAYDAWVTQCSEEGMPA